MHQPEVEKDKIVTHKVSGVSIVLSFQGCCHLIFTFLGIVMCLVALASWKDLGDKDKFIVDYLNNWKMKPIVDIEVTKTSRCPPGYENLISRNIATQVGGEGQDAFSNSTHIYLGNCDINQTSFGGERIPAIGPTPLTKFYSHKIGGFREGQSFIDIERPVKVNNSFKGTGNK